MKLKNQLKNTAILVAIPLASVLKSSAVTRRGIGPEILKIKNLSSKNLSRRKNYPIILPGPNE